MIDYAVLAQAITKVNPDVELLDECKDWSDVEAAYNAATHYLDRPTTRQPVYPADLAPNIAEAYNAIINGEEPQVEKEDSKQEEPTPAEVKVAAPTKQKVVNKVVQTPSLSVDTPKPAKPDTKASKSAIERPTAKKKKKVKNKVPNTNKKA